MPVKASDLRKRNALVHQATKKWRQEKIMADISTGHKPKPVRVAFPSPQQNLSAHFLGLPVWYL
ncbi:MAG: hypothetical protein ACK5R0_10025, partial [Bacteroidota bacterium]